MKIETPEFLRQNGLKIDYKHYLTNQIAKPVAQIFGLALEQMQGFNRAAFTQAHRPHVVLQSVETLGKIKKSVAPEFSL